MKTINAAVLITILTLSGCALFGPAVRTALDIARELCELTAAEQGEGKLGGMSAAEWCAIEANIEPFVDEVLAAKNAASQKAGFARGSDHR